MDASRAAERRLYYATVQQKKQTSSFEMEFGEKTASAKSGLGWMDGRRMHFAAAPGVDPLLLALAVLEDSVYVYECLADNASASATAV